MPAERSEQANETAADGRRRLRLGPAHALLILLAGLLFLVHAYLPLRANDLWVHVNYGDWILEHRALPEEDPVMPFSEGMKVVDGEWLSQVIFAWVERGYGPEGLAILFSLTVLVTYLILGRCYWRVGGGKLVAVLGVAIALGVGFSRLTTIRPENFGVLCFAALLWLLAATGADREPGEPLSSLRLWVGVPFLFALWVNLHGSYPAGLAVLGLLAVGRFVEVAWRERSLAGALADRPFRRWLLAAELGFVATLANPYGPDLLLETARFAGNENLPDIVEWQALVFTAWGGREFVLSWVLLIFLLRHSQRRMPVAHVLLLGLFSWAVLAGNRFLSFYAPLFSYLVAPHLAELLGRSRGRWAGAAARVQALARRLSLTPRVWAAACALVIWAVFAVSPLSRPLLGGRERTAQEIFGRRVPVALAGQLRQSPPSGPVFAPQPWADYLVWAGPPGLQPMVTSMIHLIPGQVWDHYMGVHHGSAGWTLGMDFYRIDTVLLDRSEHDVQVAFLRRHEAWEAVWEDRLAVRFERRVGDATGTTDGRQEFPE